MTNHKLVKNPIIFIGSGRSGTTIISEIIMRHPDIAFPSNYQDKFYRKTSVNLIRNIFDNRFWRVHGSKPQLNKVGVFNKYYFKPSEAYQMWDYLTGKDINFSRDFLLDKKISNERLRFIREYFSRMVGFQRRRRLAFKITGPSRISFLLQIFPDATFVNLKRRIIPTISSFLKVDFWKTRGYSKLWWTGAYTAEEEEWAERNADNPAELTAFQLKKVNKITEIEVKKYNPGYIEVNYEAFVRDPQAELDSLSESLGLGGYDLSTHLKEINIYNRNKEDSEYFSPYQLQRIKSILDN